MSIGNVSIVATCFIVVHSYITVINVLYLPAELRRCFIGKVI